ncbi:MAG: histidine triad nucleotide-binding protein [Planctomycetes bacterium]|nr:histidine triad nucleotide-binding protein [Planctomycetota bacterium]MCB9916865.1 histidine triad nucleotide-binding protein [Planctomycetota bacterium]
MTDNDNPTIFGKILRGEVPADVVWDDIHCLAFRDIAPKAPHHILIIPKRHLPKLSTAREEDRTLLGHLLFVAGEIARQEGFANDGFRTVINDGRHGGQEVMHLHVHVLGGRELAWPPG